MVHFTFCDFGAERVFGVEVYDKELNPVGYAPIESIPITNKSDNFLQWFVEDMDRKGNFYLRERYRDGSRIRVIHIDFAKFSGS